MKILKILNEKFFSKSKSEANKLEKDFHNYLSRFVIVFTQARKRVWIVVG